MPAWDVLVTSSMAMLATLETQAFSHVIGTCHFIKVIYVYSIIILLLGLSMRAIVMVVVGIGKGNGGIPSIDVAIDFHNSSDVLFEVIGDISHHMDGVVKE
jgi:hypothetical protein